MNTYTFKKSREAFVSVATTSKSVSDCIEHLKQLVVVHVFAESKTMRGRIDWLVTYLSNSKASLKGSLQVRNLKKDFLAYGRNLARYTLTFLQESAAEPQISIKRSLG